MKLNASSLFPTLLMAMLAGLTFFLSRIADGGGDEVKSLRHDPDYYADNFTIKRFDINGALQNTVTATHMQHYPDDDSTDLTLPQVIYHGARPTKATAKTASVDSGGKTIVLRQQVKVIHENGKGSPPTEITTEELTVLTDDEIAKTHLPVTITQGKSVVHGTGLVSNNKTRQSVLSGPTNGTIASAPK